MHSKNQTSTIGRVHMDPSAMRNRWVGRKIISMSNAFVSNAGDNSLHVGVITDLIPLTKSMTLVPKAKFDDVDEEVLCMSVIMPYSDILLSSLNKLTAKERWSIIEAFTLRFNC